ncbi:MAG: hypothetical protein WCI76_00820 [bacterium]
MNIKFSEALSKNTRPPTVIKEGHSLGEIVNGAEGPFFTRFLITKKSPNLAAKVAQAMHPTEGVTVDFTEKEFSSLMKFRKEFSGTMSTREEVRELLTADNITHIASGHAEFSEMVSESDGPNGALTVTESIKRRLDELAVTDIKKFDAISKAMREYAKQKKEAEELDNLVIEKCRQSKIEPAELLKVLKLTDPKEKEEQLEKLSFRTYGWFKWFVNGISNGSLAKNHTYESLTVARDALGLQAKGLDDAKTGIGTILLMTIKKDKLTRSSLTKTIFAKKLEDGESPELESEAEPQGLREAKVAENARINKAQIQVDWNKWKKDSANISTPATPVIDFNREGFIKKQKERPVGVGPQKEPSFFEKLIISVRDAFTQQYCAELPA